MQYDFKTLNDKEFEILCCDLLSLEFGRRIERFKPGKDKGVDGRFFRADGGEFILQCKHWVNTPIETLISHLRVKEKIKVDALAPGRYVLAVSNRLSRADKHAISEALAPHLKSAADIYGQEDLNDLIFRHKEVEERHYKLWLSSSRVLTHLMNRAIIGRSDYTMEHALAEAGRYVKTSNHERALERLEKLRVVILTGEAGVGKTTLAEHLCVHYMANGFRVLQIAEEIHEAENVFDPDAKQIFYFDDFLGANYLEALSGHEGNQIVSFIRRVSRDANKRFVLTSRNTILNQGKALIDKFQHHNLDRNEFELQVSTVTDIDKARILYSHIWNSSLGPEYVEELYKEKRYRQIIAHRNFNPRLISFITDPERLADCESQGYWDYVLARLTNPADIWEHPFSIQLDDFGRAMVMLVTLNQRFIGQSELTEAYARFIGRPENAHLSGKKDFLLTLRHVAGSFLNRQLLPDGSFSGAILSLFNPSVGDFVLRRCAQSEPDLRAALLSLRSASSLQTLTGMYRISLISEGRYRALLASISDECLTNSFSGYDTEYAAILAMEIVEDEALFPAKRPFVVAALHFVLGELAQSRSEEESRLVLWGIMEGEASDEEVSRFISSVSQGDEFPSKDAIDVLLEIRDALYERDSSRAEDIAQNIRPLVISYLSDSLGEEIEDDKVFDEVEYGDASAAEENLERLLNRWLDRHGVEATKPEMVDFVRVFDIDDRMQKYFEGGSEGEYHGRGSGAMESDDIDDLFHRG